MIKAWRCRLNHAGYCRATEWIDSTCAATCRVDDKPCDATEVVITPLARHEEVQAVLAAAEKYLVMIVGLPAFYDEWGGPPFLNKENIAEANEALTKIRKVVKK